jgi:L-malate glycosyltransferase
MRIVYLADAPYIHTRRWVEHFAGLGHECEVVSFRPAAIGGARVHHVQGFERLGKARYLVQARRVAHLIRSLKPDLLHALHLTSYGFLGALAAIRPYILSVEGMDILESPRLTPFHSWLTRYALARANEVTASSLHLATSTARYAPRSNPITVVPYGADMDRFQPRQREAREPVVIGTAGRLSPEKGQKYLLEAFARLRGLVSTSVRLRIAGEGPEEGALRKQAERLGISEVSDFVGWLEHDDLPSFFHSLDIFALPSLYESFGVAAVEASASGLPVVASNLQGLPDVVVDGLTGLLVPPKRPGALAGKLALLVEDAELRRRLGSEGRRFVHERYSWAENARQMERVYEAALARRPVATVTLP